jgi:hypothetical protein
MAKQRASSLSPPYFSLSNTELQTRQEGGRCQLFKGPVHTLYMVIRTRRYILWSVLVSLACMYYRLLAAPLPRLPQQYFQQTLRIQN